jgi:hypothetical protein
MFSSCVEGCAETSSLPSERRFGHRLRSSSVRPAAMRWMLEAILRTADKFSRKIRIVGSPCHVHESVVTKRHEEQESSKV